MSSLKNIDTVEEQVKHYQKKLEKYAVERKIDNLLYCIHKLKHLPVTVAHLEKTGVGKSVNMLRIYDGITGEKARALVTKWKEMVSAEEELETEAQDPESMYNHTEEIESTEYVRSESNAASDEDKELQIAMMGEYDSNGNDLTVQDRTQNGYNPYTSREDYRSAGSSKPASYSPMVEYVPTQTITLDGYKTSKEMNKDCSPTTKLNIKENVTNGNDSNKNNVSSEDIISKTHKSKHKSKDKAKHKHKHHSKDKKKSKHSPSKTSHYKEDKTPSSNHTTTSQITQMYHTSETKQKIHVNHDNKDGSQKNHDKPSSSKKAIEPMNDFESALLGLDNYPTTQKRRKFSKEKTKENKLCEPSTSKAISSSILEESSRVPRLPSFMNEITDNSLQLSTSYKPIPQVVNKSYDSHAQKCNEEEGLNFMYLAKNSRQKIIYTGKSSSMSKSGMVPSLFNQCIRVLQDNIDALEYTGGIPYMILKPVIERAKPVQLFNIENFNPYLLEDTSPLWEIHCKRHFKNMLREEMETWRDMFIRCTDEKEQKLKNVTEMLERKFITKAVPKRTTQLAEFIGAPGKNFKKRAKSLYNVPVVSKVSTNSATTSTQAVSKQSTRQPMAKKPKMGVMMAKSLQLYKKIYRR